MKEKYIFLKDCLSRNFLILEIIPIDFDILFLMYVICAAFTLNGIFVNIHCYVVTMFYSCSMKHHIVSFFKLIVNLFAFNQMCTFSNSLFKTSQI